MAVASQTKGDPQARADLRQARGAATRDSILRATVRLMAEGGYNGVSLRQICMEADVNLALLNYHFGNKGQLILAIFERWGKPISDERDRRLDQVEAEAQKGGGSATLEALIAAFVEPTLQVPRAERQDVMYFLRMSGRLATDPTPEVRTAVALVYDSAAMRFVRAVQTACKHLSNEELLLRLVFLYGALVYTRSETGRVELLAKKLALPALKTPMRDASPYLVTFLAAGLRAPPTKPS